MWCFVAAGLVVAVIIGVLLGVIIGAVPLGLAYLCLKRYTFTLLANRNIGTDLFFFSLHVEAPFTRCNLLSNRFDNRLYRVNGV